jgi:UDP-N-acetylglucosamine diphosphorylase/glucosamine-1-phosphate N-acetyltransferase
MAAGEGNRMRPLTTTRPKVMLPIANKPILEHLVIEAREAGIAEFILVVGYCDQQVRDYFGSGEKLGVNIGYSEQRKQLGTADAVRMVADKLDGNFVVMNGDVVVNRRDIANLVNDYDTTTLSVIAVENPTGLGMVELKDNKVVRIHEKIEKPPSNLANAGLYLFTPDIHEAIARTEKSPRGEYEITDSIQLLIDSGREVSCQEIEGWTDLSYPWNLLTVNQSLLEDIESDNQGTVEANVNLNGTVSIGKGTLVRSGVYINGPVIIGENCDIGPNCFIRGATSIGDGCRIGAAVEVKNSIIMRGTKIPHHNYVGDSVIGENCNLGAGTKIANLRLDKTNVSVNGIATGRRKLGAIIGDNVETGINASINVGCIIGDNTFIGPGALASGIIASGSKIL